MPYGSPSSSSGDMMSMASSTSFTDEWDAAAERLFGNAEAREAAGAGGYRPDTLALRVQELNVGTRHLTRLVAGVSLDAGLWRANLDADQLNGYVEYRPPARTGSASAGRVFARLSRLSLPRGEVDQVESLLDQQPATLPALDIVVDDLELRGKRLGRLEIEAVNRSSGQGRDVLRDWQLSRLPQPAAPQRSRYSAQVASDSAGFAFTLQMDSTQPVLLQGDAGVSKKGPGADETSRYYSEPQLAVQGTLTLEGQPIAVTGRAWLDHEWSDAFIPPQAVGWDWVGMNLDDGSALTAFRLRRADGGAVYAGGSVRRAGEAVRSFGPDEVRFTPGRIWESAASRARYPVQWTVATPAGRFGVVALLDNQELDSRSSTGAIYWEGLSDLLDEAGSRIGRGYLEMTGYAAALRL